MLRPAHHHRHHPSCFGGPAGGRNRGFVKQPPRPFFQAPPMFSAGLFIFMDYTKLAGLIPAVVQDETTSEVLMVGFMNEEAFERTRATGFATFFSRTRNTLWMKGETSGNRLQVTSMLIDCDDDTVLLKVKRLGDGNVCHTGTRTCFRPV